MENTVVRTYVPAGQYSQPATEHNAMRVMLEIADAMADGQDVTATRQDYYDSLLYTVTIHDEDGGRTHFIFTDGKDSIEP